MGTRLYWPFNAIPAIFKLGMFLIYILPFNFLLWGTFVIRFFIFPLMFYDLLVLFLYPGSEYFLEF